MSARTDVRRARGSALLLGLATVAGLAVALSYAIGEPAPSRAAERTTEQVSIVQTGALLEPDAVLSPLRSPAPDLADSGGAAPLLATRVFAGEVRQRDGQPLAPTAMFVHAPQRSLLDDEGKQRSSHMLSLRDDGAFRIELPADLFRDAVYVNLVEVARNSTLFTGLVELSSEVDIVVDGPGSEALRPLTGRIEVLDAPVVQGDLLILDEANHEPVTYQWNVSGHIIDVDMPVCLRRFADVRGGVRLLLTDREGLQLSLPFENMTSLQQALVAGLKVRPDATELLVADLAGDTAEYVDVAPTGAAKIGKRYPVLGGRVRLRTSAGPFELLGVNENSGREGKARVRMRAGDVAVRWDYVTPGPCSHVLSVRGPDGRGLEGAKVRYRLRKPVSADVVPDRFRWSGVSGADGMVYAAGLLPGDYWVGIQHDDHVARRVAATVPGPAMKATLAAGRSVIWQLAMPAGQALDDVRVAYLRRGAQRWRVRGLGVGSLSRDYVIRGMAPGDYRFVVYSSTLVGVFDGTLKVGDTRPLTAAVQLEPANACHVAVRTAAGEPVAGVQVQLLGDAGARPFLRVHTDANGAADVPMLPCGAMRVRVVDETGRVLGRAPLTQPCEVVLP